MEDPQNGRFIMENTIKIDDLGVPPFMESPTCSSITWKPHDTSPSGCVIRKPPRANVSEITTVPGLVVPSSANGF